MESNKKLINQIINKFMVIKVFVDEYTVFPFRSLSMLKKPETWKLVPKKKNRECFERSFKKYILKF